MTQSLAAGSLDLHTLLRPISEDGPTGDFLLYEGTYDRIREARRSDDASQPRGIWDRDLKAADWALVESLCLDALERRSKDIQIAGWMTEAAFRLRGFKGLREGLEVLLRLSEAYWNEIHPPLDHDGEFRAAPFHWMNEKLAPDLFHAVVASPQGDRDGVLTWHDWKRSVWLETMRARSPKEAEAEAKQGFVVAREEFNRRVAATARVFYDVAFPELTRSLELVKDLEGLLDREMRERSPSLVRFRENLSEIHGWMRTALRETHPPQIESQAMKKEDPVGDGPATPVPEVPAARKAPVLSSSAGGAINGREEAYRQLEQAALYLRAIEPHSPAPYLALRAVAWGEKSLNELIREFMKNGLDLEALTTLLGLEESGGRQ